MAIEVPRDPSVKLIADEGRRVTFADGVVGGVVLYKPVDRVAARVVMKCPWWAKPIYEPETVRTDAGIPAAAETSTQTPPGNHSRGPDATHKRPVEVRTHRTRGKAEKAEVAAQEKVAGECVAPPEPPALKTEGEIMEYLLHGAISADEAMTMLEAIAA